MKMEMKDELGSTVERLAAAAGLLEQTVERLAQRQNDFALDAEASIGRIVATVEGRREAELEEKLAAAVVQIAELKAAAASSVPATVTNGRKTLPVAMTNLLTKQGVAVDSMEASSVDAALVSLSIEQRIAVKAQLMRAGLLG
jgi:phosphoserine phosphatase